jgi:hypothetical protein
MKRGFVRSSLLDPDETKRASAEFAAARPFPHVELRDTLVAEQRTCLIEAFPTPTWEGWHRYGDAYQQGKMICNQIEAIPASLVELIHELQSPTMLAYLEQLTGIEGLIPDPHLEGGGLHLSGPGGILAPHTDFHIYPRLGVYRRVNVLLYLNEGWEESDGGCLELYEPGATAPAKIVVPAWGTCVIFRTDDRSPHGFSTPVVGDRWRRSIALYYYTAEEPERYSGDMNTYWQRLPVTTRTARARQWAYEALLLGSRGLGFFAHRIDPNLSRRRRDRP